MRRTAAMTVGAAGAAALAGAGLRWRSGRRRVADANAEADYLLEAGTTHKVLTADGALLAVTDAGDGPAVVLAHCWMGSREVWAPVANRLLRQGHRVVLYDQRGHGESTAGAEGFSIGRLGADLAEVLEERDLRDAVLAGHSMGGMTVMAALADRPDLAGHRARAAVLVSTAAGGLAGQFPPGAARVLSDPLTDRVLASPFGHLLQRGVVGATVCPDHLVRWRDVMVSTDPEVRVGCMRAIGEMELRDALRDVDMPVTVVVGSHDRLTPRRYAEEIVGLVPGSELRVLQGFGHTLPFEAAESLARIIGERATA